VALQHYLECVGIVAGDQFHQLLVRELSQFVLGIDTWAS
jgi:hypothetical protein